MSTKDNKYPLCPECGYNTIVGFTPPKEPAQFELLGTPEYVDWNRARLYCCNGETNCKYNTRFLDLTTPMTEPKYHSSTPSNWRITSLKEELATTERNVLGMAVTCVEDELRDLKHRECKEGIGEICDDCLHHFMQNQTLQRIIESLKWQLTNDSSKE